MRRKNLNKKVFEQNYVTIETKIQTLDIVNFIRQIAEDEWEKTQ